MSEVRTKIPLDPSRMNYAKSWHADQEELDAYDDHMRRKLNFQSTEYSMNNELICFGLSEHIIEEEMPMLTEKAAKDITILRSWFKRDRPEDTITRPAYRSDWNWTSYTSRAQLRVLLGVLVIRELPVKNFYVRCWLTYIYIVFFVIRGLGRGLKRNRPIVLYN